MSTNPSDVGKPQASKKARIGATMTAAADPLLLTQKDIQKDISIDRKKACADAQGPVNSRAFNRRGLGSTSSVTINDYGNVTRYLFDGQNRKLEAGVRLTSSGDGDGTNIGAT